MVLLTRSLNNTTLLSTATLLLLLACMSTTTQARVVTFQYQENTATCKSLSKESWDIELGNIYVDCGNANHGCTAGHSIMIDADCKC